MNLRVRAELSARGGFCGSALGLGSPFNRRRIGTTAKPSLALLSEDLRWGSTRLEFLGDQGPITEAVSSRAGSTPKIKTVSRLISSRPCPVRSTCMISA